MENLEFLLHARHFGQTHKTQMTGHDTAQQKGKTVRVKNKYTEKVEKNIDLAHETKRIWQLKPVKIITIIIGVVH